ncbi:MAG: polysaccharide deacetylase family protein [Clostridia bacterium]|nr:polysaccharide deacetylase family protein [Clostridia bacterium]
MNYGRGAGARRRRQRDRRLLIAAAAGVLAVILIVVLILVLRRRNAPDPVQQPPLTQTETSEATAEPMLTIDTPQPTPATTPGPTVLDTSANSVYRPVAEAGFLPVFDHSDTPENIIAITVDDVYQAENLQTIVNVALDNGAKLTIFPVGENAVKAEQADVLRFAWENGMELENHTMTHNGLYNCTDEELAWEIYQQNLSLSSILGVEYSVHFLRPKGGSAKDDQRIHAYCSQLGYAGIAHWKYSGSKNEIEDIKASLAPGTVYLFHTTNGDTQKLEEFIPYAVGQGYRLVTLNQMFGYPDNETAALTEPVEGRTAPALQPYDEAPVTYKRTTYAYGAYLLQQKLIALGYMSGEADGVYGKDSATAVSTFQSSVGLPATGEADPETQAKIDELFQIKFPNGIS